MRRLASLATWVLLWPAVAAAQSGEVIEYYHLDALGSVRAVSDAQGTIIRTHDYLPFGEEWSATAGDSLLFTGKERDAETGFDYFGARYYSPRLGRFTTADAARRGQASLADPQRWNRYAYSKNNPLRYLDPDGRYEIDVHYDLTYALAFASGIAAEVAARIARADQAVDDSWVTCPIACGEGARADYHFTTPDRGAEMWWDFELSHSPEYLGMFLHAEQDSFSHAGFGPSLGQITRGTRPDKTYNDPARAVTMAADTYGRLMTAAAKLPGNHAAPLPWKTVEPFVRAFAKARTMEEKKRILYQLQLLAERIRREQER